MHNWMVDNDVLFTSCHIRKLPSVLIRDQNNVKLVWESSCSSISMDIQIYQQTSYDPMALVIPLKIGEAFNCTTITLNAKHHLHECFLRLNDTSSFYHVDINHKFPDEQEIDERNHVSFSFWFPGKNDPEISNTQISKDCEHDPYKILIVSDSYRGGMHFIKLLNLALHRDQSTLAPSFHSLLACRGKASNNYPPHQSHHFLFHLGNAVSHAFWLNEWQVCFFDPLSWTGITPTLPIAFVQGNNDVYNGFQSIYVDSIPISWYTIWIGNTYFIVTDTNRFEESDQISWINEQISSKECKEASFCILLAHIAPYIEYWERDTWSKDSIGPKIVRNVLLQAKEYFYQQHDRDVLWPIDMVISGHQQNYQRGSKNESINDIERYCMYIIAGGGGDSSTEKVHDWGDLYSITWKNGHFYAEITLYDHLLKWNVYADNGDLVDSIEIKSKHLY